jgi:hypothetical protein
MHQDRNTPEVTAIMADVISFDFPERHVRDFVTSSRIYYDHMPTNSAIGVPLQDLIKTHEGRTPWVLSFIFDRKKITSKAPWVKIYTNIEKVVEENFEVHEKFGYGESEQPPEIALRCFAKVADIVAAKTTVKE